MRRRDFIKVIAGSTTAWPLAARAQQSTKPVIGFLNVGAADSFADRVDAFRKGLGETGYVDSQNVVIVYRWAQGQYDRLPGMAADFAAQKVAVIVATGGPPAALAAKAATSTIPIVFNVGDDPVRLGLVASLNRPAGNLTGASFLVDDLLPKQLDILIELNPKASAIGMLVNPNNATAQSDVRALQEASDVRGRKLFGVEAGAQADFQKAFAALSQQNVGALIVVADGFFSSQIQELASLTKRHAIPAIYGLREFPVAGGLIAYGASITEVYRQVGNYTGRILKGERPADLPVIQPTKFELVINLKTAKILGITVPQILLVEATELIE